MPQSDSVEEYIAQRGLFVPFSKLLFNGQASLLESISTPESFSGLTSEHNLLPAVCSTASAKWSGRENDRATESCARIDIITGEPAADCNPNAAAKRKEIKQKKRKQILDDIANIVAGEECYINLAAWPEYHEEWLYASPMEKTFVKGIYGAIAGGKGRR